MANHEIEIQAILGRFGEEARKILESAGIPVEKAIGEILESEKEEEDWQVGATRKGQSVEIADLPIRDITISELVWLCSLPSLEREADFEQELHRRLALLELTELQQNLFIALDLAALEEKDPLVRNQAILPGRYIHADTTIENLPDPTSCLTTELIMIYEDVNATRIREHEWLQESAIKAIGYAMGHGADSNGPYFEEFDRRVSLMGFEPWQGQTIIKNVCLIVGKAKWDYTPPEESWTEESLVRKGVKWGKFQ